MTDQRPPCEMCENIFACSLAQRSAQKQRCRRSTHTAQSRAFKSTSYRKLATRETLRSHGRGEQEEPRLVSFNSCLLGLVVVRCSLPHSPDCNLVAFLAHGQDLGSIVPVLLFAGCGPRYISSPSLTGGFHRVARAGRTLDSWHLGCVLRGATRILAGHRSRSRCRCDVFLLGFSALEVTRWHPGRGGVALRASPQQDAPISSFKFGRLQSCQDSGAEAGGARMRQARLLVGAGRTGSPRAARRWRASRRPRCPVGQRLC